MASEEGSSNVELPARRERAAIAAQACQTCRSRKSKCDERRPKCGLCQRLGLECQYREPLPTKKDKTMIQILDAINRLEVKFDNLHPAPISSIAAETESRASSTTPGRTATSSPFRFERLSAPHKILVWPTVYVHLSDFDHPAVSDLQYVVQDGTTWLVRHKLQDQTPQINVAAALQSVRTTASSGVASPRVVFPALSIQHIQTLTEAFFQTFNVLCPIIDQNDFTNVALPALLTDGYGYGDTQSALALLVFALGQVALEGTLEAPILSGSNASIRSGIRGGSLINPPGIEMFNEARRRLAMIANNCSMEMVQCLLLQAMYFNANSMQLDFWRSSTAASSVCQLLVRNSSLDQQTLQWNLLRRIYWTCHLNETICRFELCLPGTGIQTIQSMVPMPSVDDLYQNLVAGLSGNDAIQRQEHYFYALLSLEKLINDINLTILEPAAEQTQTASVYHGPPMPLVREIARQLDSWRSLLPRHLKWLDHEMFDFPRSDYDHRRPSEQLFAPDQGPMPIRHRNNLDITIACLRTRFYYAKHLLYQPFIYKVLHFPEIANKDDAACVAMAMRSGCMWPILMAPVKDKKRLVPYLFSWTQSFISMLLIFEMTRVNEALRSICEDSVDPSQVKETVALMLEWLRDAQQWDGMAAWSYPMLEALLMR